ncbi:Na+/H+ antiporter subunit E [Kineococcus sp. LSe6-4]|uniref:Na+/H+ antiporter subunit E n=1 Tax=Kineococcus halophytocola TaxID=3234027 RepID=A0ABV4H575_9ACTN
MRLSRALAALMMLLTWFALWGKVTPLNAVGGVLVVAALVFSARLPDIPSRRRLAPVGLGLLLGHVLVDLVRSSVEMAWLSVRPGPAPAGAIVAVGLRDGSDEVLTTTAQLLTLVPGTLTVDVDVPSATLYVHVPVTGDVADVPERVREQVLGLEAKVRGAFPAREEEEEP